MTFNVGLRRNYQLLVSALIIRAPNPTYNSLPITNYQLPTTNPPCPIP
ncbi:MAG: hypothetical protein AAF630_18835 [Cyanobacteria bacterium P01_C01_bin.38]